MRLLPIAFALCSVSLCLPANATVTPEKERWSAFEQHQSMRAQTLLHGIEWRSIGPTVQGGRVVDIEGVPGQPYTFYVVYASGGVWKTVNNGVTFEPLTDFLATMINGDLALDPQNSQTLWLGTGEPNSSRSSYSGMGVFKSIDGGKTWQSKGLADTDRISRIVVDAKDSAHVCVAAIGRLYTAGGARGVFCTRDDGASWKNTLPAASEWTGAIDLTVDPSNPKTLYAATWERSRRPWNFVEAGKNSGVWKSTDGGDHWQRLENFPSGEGIGRIGLAVSASQPGTLYASIDNNTKLTGADIDLGDSPFSSERLKTMSKAEFLRFDEETIERFIRGSDITPEMDAKKLIGLIKSDQLSMDGLREKLYEAERALFDTEITGLQVYRSDDAGTSWHRTHTDVIRGFVSTYGYYFGQIRVAPDNPDHIAILAFPLAISNDGGKTFLPMNDNDLHADHHAWWYDPKFPQRILSGQDGGIDATYDGGKNWTRLDHQALGQSYAVTFDMAEPYNVYTGLQDNGTWKGSSRASWKDDNAWQFISGGDGMQVQVDPRDNQTVYSGYQFGFYARNGADTRPREDFDDKDPLRYNWQSPILLSSHNADVLYFGSNKLYRSMDKGETWSAISADLTSTKERGDVPFGTITTLSESTKQFGLLWAGTDDGHVQVTNDGGVSWREVSSGMPGYYVSRVAASSHVRDRAYVSVNGYREDQMTAFVYSTDDLGKTWKRIDTGLPAEPVNVVAEDPVNPDLLYVGTDRGVYVSLDRGASWQNFNNNLPNVPVHDLKVHPRERELIAGTHGRSVWIADVLPLQELSKDVQAQALKLFALEKIQYGRDWQSEPSRWFDRLEDHPKVKLTYWAKQDGAVKLTVTSSDKSNLREINLNAKRGLNTYDYDLLLEQKSALAAEAAHNAKALKKGDLKQPLPFNATPYKNAQQYGWPMLLQPGEYTLTLNADGAKAQSTLTVKPAEPLKPRRKPKFVLRGRDD
jgi:photosystem II stability/assembly factor-like uncharacterized protein